MTLILIFVKICSPFWLLSLAKGIHMSGSIGELEYRLLESVYEHALDSTSAVLQPLFLYLELEGVDCKDHLITQIFRVVYLSRCDFSIRFSTIARVIYLGIVLNQVLNTLGCRQSHTAILNIFSFILVIRPWQQFHLSYACRPWHT
jgi:hypothetical protein